MGLELEYLLETHAHADHLTGISYFKRKYPQAKTAISKNIKDVQGVLSDLFDLKADLAGADFDMLLTDGQEITLGDIKITALATPGHTPACMTFVANNEAAFTGDLLFAPDYGTGRCDFPAGSSTNLYHSIQNKIYTLNDNIRVYPGHDYMPGDRMVWESASVKTHKEENVQIKPETKEAEFVAFRDGRDNGLAAPKLLLQSVQFNAWAGKAINEKTSFLKIPLRIKR